MNDDEIKGMKAVLKDIGFTVVEIDPGDEVNCDLCNKSFKDSTEEGGYMFLSKAVCPDCGPRFEESAKGYGEGKYIGHRAKDGESFRDFVYRMRMFESNKEDK